MKKEITIALAGNPNAGKTTIFNHLTGARQKVGNWSGVTVEKKEGSLEYKGTRIKVVDLPGIYSLTAYSVEEIVARDFILEEHPDVVVDIIDASNLERNLYLATQLIELNIPLVFAMNMVDVARARGIMTDFRQLSRLLGVPIVETVGTRGMGIDELLDTGLEVCRGSEPVSRHVHVNYGQEVEKEIRRIREEIRKYPEFNRRYYPRWVALKLLEKDTSVWEKVEAAARACIIPLEGVKAIREQVEESRANIARLFEEDAETVIAEARYGFIAGALKETMRLSAKAKRTVSDRIDQVLTNRILGFPVFVLFMYLLFQGTFTMGAYPVAWIETGVELLARIADHIIPPGMFHDLMIDGVIGGVGGVIVFLPNILILFLGISLLEDTGYMARAAFIMDRVMHTLGLHGKSFIPLLMGFGCNVPAIMAARTLETRRDRLLTILINPLMSCSARLPVYVLIAGAFFPGREGNIIFAIYFLGIALAIIMGQIFSRTLFKGETTPFVMELPPYRMPTLLSVMIHMWEKTKVYLQKMGGVVLAFSVVIWFLGNFPKDIQYSPELVSAQQAVEKSLARCDGTGGSATSAQCQELKQRRDEIERAMENQRLASSYIGRIGHAVEPLIKPLGFDWRLGVSLITGFVAKEVVVSTMGVLYQAGDSETGSVGLVNALKKSGLTPVTAFGFMVFVLIYVPCMVTVVTIWRETGSMGWTCFTVGYLMTLAWIMAFLIRVGCLAMKCVA